MINIRENISLKPYHTFGMEVATRYFAEYDSVEEAKVVRNLIEEIRAKKYYMPELEFVMVNENDEIMGHVLFSRFHIEGKYENEFLMLTPVSVKTELQRQHISKELIEYGLKKAKDLGYKFCMVEGNPQNYRSRGFLTSADFGIFADDSLELACIALYSDFEVAWV